MHGLGPNINPEVFLGRFHDANRLLIVCADQARKSSPRLHIRWLNRTAHAKWQQGKQAVSYNSCLRDAATAWASMTEAERLRAESGMVSGDEDAAVEQVADTCRAEDMLAIGDGYFSLRTDKFIEFVEGHRDATRPERRPRSDGELGGGGLAFSCGARAAAECAKGQKGKFFVSDVQDIPGARKILRPRSCTQIHPGLCCQTDFCL